MRKELPLKHIDEPSKLDKGAESEVFKFKPEKGKEKEYVYKEIYNESALDRYPGKTLEEKAAEMKIVFDILKNRYGDKVAKTHFIIGKNKEGGPCIIKIQEKIKGDYLSDLNSEDFERIEKGGLLSSDPTLQNPDSRFVEAVQQVQEIRDDFSQLEHKIKKHPKFKDRSDLEVKDMIFDIYNSQNIIVDKRGNITIFDW